MANKKIIAINFSGIDSKIGSLHASMVVIKPSFLRDHYQKIIAFPDKIDSFKTKIERVYVDTMGARDLVEYMQPWMIEMAISMLNTYPKFWEHNIYIYFPLGKTVFMDNAEFPQNLSKVPLKTRTWHISGDSSPKALHLAKMFADKSRKEEIEHIKLIYGDYNSEDEFIKNNLDNLHVRPELRRIK